MVDSAAIWPYLLVNPSAESAAVLQAFQDAVVVAVFLLGSPGARLSNPSLLNFQLLWHQLMSAADEMGLALVRTSFSTIVKENQDYACSILAPDGSLVTQSRESVPSYIGMFRNIVRAMIDRYPLDSLDPEDVLVTNDPWLGAGHLHDIITARPVFNEDRLVAWVSVVSHVPDIGGALSPVAKEVYAEGLCIPPLRIVAAGVENADLMAIIAGNVRSANEVLGDIRGQFAALTVGAAQVRQIIQQHDLSDLDDFCRELWNRSERVVRERIADTLMVGDYEADVQTEGLDRPFHIQATIKVTDSQQVVIDYDGTDDQVPLPINSTFNYTYAMSLYALKCMLDPHTPNNEGAFRPFEVRAPEGSIVNPRRPVAVWARHLVGHYLPFLMFKAMAGHTSAQIMAESSSPSWAGYFRGTVRGRPFSYVLFANGGVGARTDRDGPSTMSFPSNTANVPVEVIENTAPFRIRRRALREGSGGLGTYRGGLGQVIEVEILEGVVGWLVIRHEHVLFPPEGLLGGGPGAVGRNLINGEEIPPKGEWPIREGDVITFELPGGGGYGSPEERATEMAKNDALADYVKPQQASVTRESPL